jgi:hypothetical protein
VEDCLLANAWTSIVRTAARHSKRSVVSPAPPSGVKFFRKSEEGRQSCFISWAKRTEGVMKCDTCQDFIGMTAHRFWRMKFCSRICKCVYKHRLAEDTRDKIRILIRPPKPHLS